jgi:hypothetical protein
VDPDPGGPKAWGSGGSGSGTLQNLEKLFKNGFCLELKMGVNKKKLTGLELLQL